MSKKARKKPVVIDFVRLTSWSVSEAQEFCGDDIDIELKEMGNGVVPVGHIETLEGVMIAKVGDYIIKGVNGEFYPCKPDIFEKTYDIIEDWNS